MNVNAQRLSLEDSLVIWLIFFHYLIYEVVFFFWYDFAGGIVAPFVTAWKLIFPVALLVYSGAPDPRVLARSGPLRLYLLLFGAFLAWSIVPSLLSASGRTSLVEWLKLVPRLFFFVGLLAFVLKRPGAFISLLRLFVGWCVLMVAQYVVLVVSGAYANTITIPGVPGSFAGPFGLLGNITSLMALPGLPLPIVRLCGFWNEPSNASGSMFAAYFAANALHELQPERRWKNVSYVLFAGGLLCLSNAGYLAISIALLFGSFFQRSHNVWSKIRRGALFLVGVCFVLIGVFGRTYISTYMPDNDIARALVGVRGDLDEIKSGDFDASGGRILLLSQAVETIAKSPQGIGIVVGGDSGMDTLSASAPVMWLTTTGLLGLMLLLGREAAVFVAVVNAARRSPLSVLAAQAWIVVSVQHTSYGSWMNPIYFMMVTFVFLTTVYFHPVRQSVVPYQGSREVRRTPIRP